MIPANPGHLAINGRWFMIHEYRYQKAPNNPMAAKLGSGAGSYDDLETWSTWLQEDWSTGLARTAADGILWGDADTRFRNKLFLSGRLLLSSSNAADVEQSVFKVPGVIAGELAAGTTQPYEEIVLKTGAWLGDQSSEPLWVMLWAPAGTAVTVSLYATLGGAALETAQITVNEIGYGWYYHYADFDTSGIFPNYVGIKPTEAGDVVYVPYTTSGANGNGAIYTNALGAHTLTDYYGFYFAIDESPGWYVNNTNNEVFVNRFPNSQSSWDDLIASTNGMQYGISETSHRWISNKSWTAAAPTDAVVWAGLLWTCYGSGTDIDTWDGTNGGGKTVLTGIKADLLFPYRGYLYRALGNSLWYTADGSTWDGPFTVGPDDFTITGMAATGDSVDIYVATEEWLYRFDAGDIVNGVFPFGSVSVRNGRGMCNFNGDLYVPNTHGVIRITGTGSVSEIWISEEEDLPAQRTGYIADMVRVNSFLFALVEAGAAGGMPTVLAYDGQGWHHIATLPRNLSPSRLFYDYQTNLLWITTTVGLVWYMYIPNQSLNPLRDANYEYAPFAWVETDWYDGELKEVIKDFESVYLAGENMSSGSITVYWQDEASTSGWEELGSFEEDTKETVWTDFGKRPQSRRIKLALLIRTDSQTATPVLNAIRVKYHNMIRDRWSWNISLSVADGKEMFDGSISEYPAEEQRAHLNAAITQTLPVRLIDIDGRRYSVKVEGATENIEKLERINETVRYDSVYSLTLVQV